MEWSDLAEIRTHLRFYACVFVTCKFEEQQRKGGDIVFVIINQWELSVAMETLSSLSSTPVMLHIKFDQYWPIDLGDI